MNTEEIKLVKALAPEDIQVGRYVTVLYEVREYMPFGPVFEPLSSDSQLQRPMRATWLPCDCEDCLAQGGPGHPLKVIAVCLPFVLVRDARMKRRSLDTRRVKLAQVSVAYAREYILGVRRAMRAEKNKTKSARVKKS